MEEIEEKERIEINEKLKTIIENFLAESEITGGKSLKVPIAFGGLSEATRRMWAMKEIFPMLKIFISDDGLGVSSHLEISKC